MSSIKLNFVNLSNDMNNSDVAFWQENVTPNYDELAIAWTVIKNCGRECNHPFEYPMGMEISGEDSWGNYTPRLAADNGEMFEVIRSNSGDILKLKGDATSPNEVQGYNALPSGSVNFTIYKDGKPLARKTGVAPEQMAVFQFKPVLFVGAASQIEEGQVINSAIISSQNTELSLFGLKSADIVMRGGGSGPDSTPLTFSLENCVMS